LLFAKSTSQAAHVFFAGEMKSLFFSKFNIVESFNGDSRVWSIDLLHGLKPEALRLKLEVRFVVSGLFETCQTQGSIL
jgi:hypothetical protein